MLGDYRQIPSDAEKSLEKTLEATKNIQGCVSILPSITAGRDEIRRAVEEIARGVQAGNLNPEDITEDNISEHLFTGKTAPGYSGSGAGDPHQRRTAPVQLSSVADCLQRTGFFDVLWPDFSPEEYEKAIEEYQSRDRRFGGR